MRLCFSIKVITKFVMKMKSLLAFVSAFAVAASLAVGAEEDTPLAKEMQAMNKTLRALKKTANDPAKKADNLAAVEKMKTNLAAAAKLEPAKTKDQPAAEKPAYLEKFKKEIAELEKAFDELKAAIDKGEGEGISKSFEKLADMKEKGHKDFAPDE
jgi:soluble cytochrome b562